MAGGRRYEHFEHTADLGLHIYGESLKELFENACEALCAQLTEPCRVMPAESREVELEANSGEELLRSWLAELLFLFSGQAWLARKAEITEITPTRLTATIYGERSDPVRHEIEVEIKAVTWHMLGIEKQADGTLRGTVVLDI